jgi:hypothetical protein
MHVSAIPFETHRSLCAGVHGDAGQGARGRLWYSPRGGQRFPAKAREALDLLKNGRKDDERGNQRKHGDNDV